ncbi:hypothetical protein HXX76_004841 [Chlamydomonas incerta]|uniref:Uncharacterized protein n=1 Tax=Chlamydomonas incerta TaxID=51695 RepID=A0A835T9E3_CHLIN|nr:hypothetical protein HXX76_004841 [Chlamydomonas incerta]|eukprot:KAG2439487.1 hypothetical protein HXX76_004841 [Chlamydomonas incerta]
MEEEDGPAGSNEERGRAACSVIAALGPHAGVTACRLDRWDYLPASAAAGLLASLPSLDSLELSGAYRVDLDALLLAPPPGLSGVTCLRINADHILLAPDLLRSAAPPTQLRELRLSGVQLNDQRSDNELCAALGVLTQLTQLELVTFSAATRPGMVALRGIHNETLRVHPLARLPAALTNLTALRILVVSDQHLELRTANALLGCLPALPHLEELVMPEARTKEEGWLGLQQATSLTRVHLYSIELKGQARQRAPGSISWWRKLRLEDTCLPELAAICPLPGLVSFIATLYMRYGDGPPPAKDFAGMDRVLATLGGAEEVRLWLELDCDIWPGLSRILGQLPGLAEVVVRARAPHPLAAPDLAALLGAATRLQYLDINNAAINDEGLRPLGDLPQLVKVCLGLADRGDGEGHSPAAVRWLAAVMAARRRPCLLVAPHLQDDELQELEEWQAEDPGPRGGLPVAAALPDLLLPLPGDPAYSAGPFFRAHQQQQQQHGGGGGGAGGSSSAGHHHGGGGGDGARFAGGGGGGSSGGGSGPGPGGSPSGSFSMVDPDDPVVLLSNSVNDFFRRVDL